SLSRRISAGRKARDAPTCLSLPSRAWPPLPQLQGSAEVLRASERGGSRRPSDGHAVLAAKGRGGARKSRGDDAMKVVDVIVEIMKREGVEFLSTYPTTPIIDAAAGRRVRPV